MAELDARVYLTAKAICAFIADAFNLSDTPNGLAKYLNRMGFRYKKPKCVPAKADGAAQKVFLIETLLPLMAEAGPDRPLYFVDATHSRTQPIPLSPGCATAQRRSCQAITAAQTSTSTARFLVRQNSRSLRRRAHHIRAFFLQAESA